MGFAFRWRWLVLCRLRRSSGETRCRTGRVPFWLGVGLRPIREYGGEIFTDYYFGEANTANKSDNHHNNAINENLNWGGISEMLKCRPPDGGEVNRFSWVASPVNRANKRFLITHKSRGSIVAFR